ncbi:MAG: DeoR/GlpR transcriptional regulator [Lentisphaeria bacterium]|nr:DeoR/GlpR transcriptional regulator [Lentisphaeria bacterium]
MGINSRHKQILEYLSVHEMLSVTEAVNIFAVSPATVRRDFTEIAASGTVVRFRGGIARKANAPDKLIPFAMRGQWYSAEKRFLAARVHRYIRDCRTLFIDGGSTTTHLGMFLRNPQQNVITNSQPLCSVFSEIFPSGGGPQIRLTGGIFHPESGLLLGRDAENFIAGYHADIAVISARGINAGGIYNHNEPIAAINRQMIAHADRTILIADHSKIGVTALTKVCSLDKIEALFTVATGENQTELAKISSTGIKVFSDCPFENISGEKSR